MLQTIVNSIHDKKGVKVISLDLTSLHDSMADYFIICEGNSPPHIRAIADNIMHEVKKQTEQLPMHAEGFGSMDWVLIDYFNIVVHVFHKEKRSLYQLEELWGDAIRMNSF